jgi:flagellar biosynthesis protein FliP
MGRAWVRGRGARSRCTKGRGMKTISPEILLFVSLGIGLVPIMIGVGTCYLKFSIVLSLLRSGFGTQQAPSNALVMALSMVMSIVVMNPVITATSERVEGFTLADARTTSLKDLMHRGYDLVIPWKEFLVSHSGERELKTFLVISGVEAKEGESARKDVPLGVALGAFVLSEIKNGFVTAFILLLPFFVIDLVLANILVGMGLTMMSPSVVGLPLKLLLFVSTDGWLMLARGLITSYR